MKLPWRRRDHDRPPRRDTDAESAPSDPRRVFQALAKHDVRYVTIGGIAVQAYGHARTTLDVDVFAAPEQENLQRLADALKELDARLYGVDADLLDIDPTDPQDLANGANFTLVSDAGRVDVFIDAQYLTGGAPWDEVAERSVVIDLPDGIAIPVVGFDDLIHMKRLASRPRDLEDIAALTDVPG